VTEPITTEQLGTLDRLWQRLYTSASAEIRNSSNEFTQAVEGWRAWYDRAMTSDTAQVLAMGAPALAPWIRSYNLQRESVPEGTDGRPPAARSLWERLADVPHQLAEAAESAAWGIGGVVLVLGGLWLWSQGRGRSRG